MLVGFWSIYTITVLVHFSSLVYATVKFVWAGISKQHFFPVVSAGEGDGECDGDGEGEWDGEGECEGDGEGEADAGLMLVTLHQGSPPAPIFNACRVNTMYISLAPSSGAEICPWMHKNSPVALPLLR
ncbi:hypothetical protein AKI39_22080 [Bordetella sp. H567]|nr:hypothetical protein AKI39_22080 [Bordetella sp. H567]